MSASSKQVGDTFTFYGGKAVLKKRMYGDKPSFKREGAESTILSVTGVTGKLDKSRALIPWAVGLTCAHMRGKLEGSTADKFGKEEITIWIDEAGIAHTAAKEAGALAGDLIHDYAHDFAQAKLEGKPLPTLDHLDETNEVHKKAINGISAFLDWYNNNDVEFLAMEEMFYYNSFLAGDTKKSEPVTEYYGFADLVARVNGHVGVVDYKSSKAVYSDQRYQVAALRHARDAELAKLKGKKGPISKVAVIVNFNKETGELVEPLVMTKEECEKDLAAFMGLLAVATREREIEKERKAVKK